MARVRVHGGENIPRSGPVIIVANHMTEIDPVIVGLAMYRQRRSPRFLAKKALFEVPVFGKLLTLAGQIPVEREAGGGGAMAAAAEKLDEGGLIIFYPEATLTRDPDLWPMIGKTGAARIAFDSGATIIPVAHWGTQNLLGRYEKKLHWWLPRTPIDVQIGEPLDLGDAKVGVHDPRTLDAATTSIMLSITAELEKLRGPKPTDELWSNRSVPKKALTPRGVSASKE